MTASQPHLPATLPTPKAARAALLAAIRAVRDRRESVERFKEAIKATQEMLEGAVQERDTAAADYAADETPSGTDRYLASVANLRERRKAVNGAKGALLQARAALAAALAEVEAADETLLAIAAGRRDGK